MSKCQGFFVHTHTRLRFWIQTLAYHSIKNIIKNGLTFFKKIATMWKNPLLSH